MIPNNIDVRKLIVKYLFSISIISLVITLFTKNTGAIVLSIICFIFTGAYLLISNKEKAFFDKKQNYF